MRTLARCRVTRQGTRRGGSHGGSGRRVPYVVNSINREGTRMNANSRPFAFFRGSHFKEIAHA
jgi:hypothetical protein